MNQFKENAILLLLCIIPKKNPQVNNEIKPDV